MSHLISLASSLASFGFPILASGGEKVDYLAHVKPYHPFLWARVGDYTITNHVIMLLLSALLLVVLVPIAARAKTIVPSGFRNLLESVLHFLREDMARPALGQHTDKFIPFIWTMFFLILTANLLGLIPLGAFAAPIDSNLRHMEGTATGNISITVGLALCSFVFIHVSGMREQGVRGYWKSFFFGHAPIWLAPLMIPLEILGALVKPFALAIRLFANMIAGHVVIAVILGFAAAGLAMGGVALGITAASILGATFIYLLEVLVAVLQAYIFTFLTTLFVGMAIHAEN